MHIVFMVSIFVGSSMSNIFWVSTASFCPPREPNTAFEVWWYGSVWFCNFPIKLLPKCFYFWCYCLSWMQINVSSVDENLNLYDSGHRFEHIQLLLVLLRTLPYALRSFQARAIQVCFNFRVEAFVLYRSWLFCFVIVLDCHLIQ